VGLVKMETHTFATYALALGILSLDF